MSPSASNREPASKPKPAEFLTAAQRRQIFDVLMSGLDPGEYPELACMVADDVTRLDAVIEDIVAEQLARWMIGSEAA